MESIAWRLIALVCGLDGIYALGMQEIDDAAFNRHINYSISMELFNFKLHLVTNNPELIFARLLSARFSYLFFIYYNRYIPIPDFISFINLLFYQFIFLTGYCSFEGNMLSKNEKENHYLLKEWKPENAAFWENKGKQIARRNLCISVGCLLLAFCVWMLFSAVAVNLNKVGFNFTTDQLFLLTALPSLSGAILRVPYSFMVPIFGGRYWTVLSTVILMVPCIWLGRHSEPRYSILGIYHHCPAVRFCRRELCFQHGKYQFFLSQSETGQRAGYQRRPRQSRRQRDADGRAGGDFSADLHFSRRPWRASGGWLSPLSNAALVWVPLLLIATFAAWFGMNDIASSKASIRDQLPVLKRPHMWLLSLLYLATFGSFIGFSAGFAMLAKTQFPDVNILSWPSSGRLSARWRVRSAGSSPTVSAACGSRW
jgi:hypothetical protein